tara:strand:- start:95653 stop:96777 length:1125 start_codon:yes stop_codon:yes gene_type:complete
MIKQLKKFKVFLFGFIIMIPVFYVLDYFNFILLPKEKLFEIFLYATIWGFLFALPFYHFKKNKQVVVRLLGLFLVLVMALIIDTYMNLPDNPITFILLMGFWIGVAYILSPAFIKKYWKLIVIIYGPLLLYFLYLRLLSGDLQSYLEIKEDFPLYIFILPIPVLFLIWIFEQWKWLQNLKAEKSNAELSLLRAQINPHFFFNTLNNLYALTVKNSKQAPEIILKLSDMMRYTIYEGEKETVRIADEIEYLSNYIELHKIRYKKSVDISFYYDSIDPHLPIPPLLFIILLENAFKHGVETLAEKAFIHIKLSDDKDSIYFTIENNFDPNEINESPGIGLKNLKRRLSLLYKNQHELIVSTSNNHYKTTLKISKHA